MNIAYIVAIVSVLLLLVFAALSFARPADRRIQLLYVVVASFNIGVLTSIIVINYTSNAALVWPGLFLVHIITKVRELYRGM